MSTKDKENSNLFFCIPVSRLIWMGIITVGIYELFWIYQNYKIIEERKDIKIMPFIRALCGLIFIYPLLRDIKGDSVASGILPANFNPKLLAIGWMVLFLVGVITSNFSESVLYTGGFIISSCSVFVWFLYSDTSTR